MRFLPAENTSVDIYVLQRMETERRWQEAADLLGGEFLEGLYLSDNSRFETWLLAERGAGESDLGCNPGQVPVTS